jgi:serine/threonine protein kinase
VLFLGVCLQEETQLIVVEWVSNGSLDQSLYKQKITFTFKQKVKVLLGVCVGMMYLHGMKPPILHRDLKPQNILVML